jgi:hypothetical protein
MLLIAIVIVASSAFYAYSVGLLGSLQQPAQHGSEILAIEDIVFVGNACKVSPIDCSAYITVRNVGSIDSKIGAIYVDDVLRYGSNGTALAVGQVRTFALSNVTNTQHDFRVATLNGSVFSTYGPQNIFIAGTFTTTITSGSITTTKTITTTNTYTTTMSTQTTLYSTQVGTTGTSTSMTTLSTTSTSLSTSSTPVSTYYVTTSTRYYKTTIGFYPSTVTTTSTRYYTSPTSTSISTSISTYQTTYATTTSAVTTSYLTTATGTTPTQTITSPVTTVVATTITTTTSSGLSSILLFLFLSMAGFLGLREKLLLSRPRKS